MRHIIPYTPRYTLYDPKHPHQPLNTLTNTLSHTKHSHYTILTTHYTLYTIHYTPHHTLQTTHTIHYTHYTIHYTQYTLYTLYTIHTIHYTLYTIHYNTLYYNRLSSMKTPETPSQPAPYLFRQVHHGTEEKHTNSHIYHRNYSKHGSKYRTCTAKG